MVRPNFNLPGGRGPYIGRDAVALTGEQYSQRSDRIGVVPQIFFGSVDGFHGGSLTAVTPTSDKLALYPLRKPVGRMELKKVLAYVTGASGDSVQCGIYVQSGTTAVLVPGSEATLNTLSTGLVDYTLTNECFIIPDEQYYIGIVGNGASFAGYGSAGGSGGGASLENIYVDKTDSGGATPWSLTLGFTPTDGNFLVAGIGSSAATVPTFTQTGVTWAQATTFNGSGAYTYLWYGYAISGATTGLSIGAATGARSIVVAEFSGVSAGTDPLDVTSADNSTSNYRCMAPSAVPTIDDHLVITVGGSGINLLDSLTPNTGTPIAASYEVTSTDQSIAMSYYNATAGQHLVGGYDMFHTGLTTGTVNVLLANFATSGGSGGATGGLPFFVKNASSGLPLPSTANLLTMTKTYQSTTSGVADINYVTTEGIKVI